jgi:hypothetical protein
VAAVGFIGSANVRQLRGANVITTSAREAGRFAVIQVDMLKRSRQRRTTSSPATEAS